MDVKYLDMILDIDDEIKVLKNRKNEIEIFKKKYQEKIDEFNEKIKQKETNLLEVADKANMKEGNKYIHKGKIVKYTKHTRHTFTQKALKDILDDDQMQRILDSPRIKHISFSVNVTNQ